MGSVAARVALYQTVGRHLAPCKISTFLQVKFRDIAFVYNNMAFILLRNIAYETSVEKLGVGKVGEIVNVEINPVAHIGHGSVRTIPTVSFFCFSFQVQG